MEYEPPTRFLEPPTEHGDSWSPKSIEFGVGSVIGPWRLEEFIASGGMGSVYRAVRADEEFDQVVAVKLLRQGLHSPALLARFHLERQVLARLEHSCITRLLDGGTTPCGQPYLVMEYVDGVPITEWCQRHELSVRQRVELFRRVCTAVDYAHKNLVIHRDLKPGNLLVDGNGQPKLLDFGIARVVSEGDESACPTRPLLHSMTPEYASPEQVCGEPMTTASEVYSLGVILFELLSGKPLVNLRDHSPSDAMRILCDPPALSEAPRRGPLSGDLGRVVRKALRSEPERRYSSVAQLSEDLDRFLEGFPVSAGPDTLAYRASRFVRRHRWSVSFGLVLLLVLLGGVIGTTAGMLRAREAEARADAKATEAERAARRAELTLSFLMGTLEGSDPALFRGEELTVRELLDRTALDLRDRFSGDPQEEHEIRRVLGSAYYSLELFEEAAEQFSGSLQQLRDGGASPADRGQLLQRLAACFVHLQRLDEAEALLDEAELLRDELPPSGVAAVYYSRAMLASSRQRPAEAENGLRRALQIHSAMEECDYASLAEITGHLAGVLRHSGRVEEGESLLRETLVRLEAADAKREVAALLQDLGGFLSRSERRDEALVPFRKALQLNREMFGAGHPHLGLSLHNLGLALAHVGEIEEGQQLLEEAAETLREGLGEDHPSYAASLRSLGALKRVDDRPVEALERLEQAFEIQSRRLPATHPSLLGTRMELALVHLELKEYEAAELHLTQTIDSYPHSPGADLRSMDWMRSLQGTCWAGMGQLQEARGVLRESLRNLQTSFGADHSWTRQTRGFLNTVDTHLASLAVDPQE